jgi:opacity protein-like surface antigen
MSRSFLMASAAACLALASEASAQENEWEFKATGYLWLPTTSVTVDTPIGNVSGELSVGDALDALEFAAMGSFEANYGKLGLGADLVYFGLASTVDTPGPLFSSGTIDVDMTVLTLAAFYRAYDTGTVVLDIGAGLRAVDSETKVRLSGGPPIPEAVVKTDWVDPIIGLRARADFNEDWFGTLYLDAGGTDSGDTMQAGLGVGYRINDRMSVIGSWRYLDFDREDDGPDVDLTLNGVMLGLSYRF